MGLIEKGADFVTGVEACYFGPNLDDGAGAIGEGVYGGGAGERILSLSES